MDMLDFLEKVGLFKDLEDDQLEVIRPCCEEADFKRGEQIFRAGENAGFLYVVLEGQIELHEEDVNETPVLSTLSGGSAFGWSALVSPYKYHLSAYCAGRTCKVLKMERGRFTKLLEEDATIGYPVMNRILALIGRRFDKLEEKVIKRMGEGVMTTW
jgi:CRP-like cAMP-binding protein